MQILIYANRIVNAERSGIDSVILNPAQVPLKWAFAAFMLHSYLHKYGLLSLDFNKIQTAPSWQLVKQ